MPHCWRFAFDGYRAGIQNCVWCLGVQVLRASDQSHSPAGNKALTNTKLSDHHLLRVTFGTAFSASISSGWPSGQGAPSSWMSMRSSGGGAVELQRGPGALPEARRRCWWRRWGPGRRGWATGPAFPRAAGWCPGRCSGTGHRSCCICICISIMVMYMYTSGKLHILRLLARWSIQIRLLVRHAQPLILSEETCEAEGFLLLQHWFSFASLSYWIIDWITRTDHILQLFMGNRTS